MAIDAALEEDAAQADLDIDGDNRHLRARRSRKKGVSGAPSLWPSYLALTNDLVPLFP